MGTPRGGIKLCGFTLGRKLARVLGGLALVEVPGCDYLISYPICSPIVKGLKTGRKEF